MSEPKPYVSYEGWSLPGYLTDPSPDFNILVPIVDPKIDPSIRHYTTSLLSLLGGLAGVHPYGEQTPEVIETRRDFDTLAREALAGLPNLPPEDVIRIGRVSLAYCPPDSPPALRLSALDTAIATSAQNPHDLSFRPANAVVLVATAGKKTPSLDTGVTAPPFYLAAYLPRTPATEGGDWEISELAPAIA